MSAPKKLRPIDVTCPFCWATPGEECYVGRQSVHRKPHVARVRAASPLPGGRDGGGM